jgi:hypothetical protein
LLKREQRSNTRSLAALGMTTHIEEKKKYKISRFARNRSGMKRAVSNYETALLQI